MLRRWILVRAVVIFGGMITAFLSAGELKIVSEKPLSMKGILTFSETGQPVPVAADTMDYPGVLRVLEYFRRDVGKVTGAEPDLVLNAISGAGEQIWAGTLGRSGLIDGLVSQGKLNVESIQGKWEASLIQVVEKPAKGVDRALVIAGSDKRGTIYGIFEISKRIGVSPWYWWADVPVEHHADLYITPGRFIQDSPKVKYRGIFLNDEEPALGRWAVENYGGFNHQFYEKVFELLLRLRGNFLWPAMWWAAFNTDDPENPRLADEMGIVMSTSHHEPMMRAHAEWRESNGGAWNYETNAEALRKFWREGIERMDGRESVVTLAMRGDGDMAMSEDTNIGLLEKIVHDQREILQQVTGKDPSEIPQVWALYKEVQDYYDKGMRVPDDVTLLLCDDNWGNVRRLPKPDDPPRAGGYGMYYHFDFVGGPRSYKWVDTRTLARIWEQMHLTYEHGVDRIWLVNVGDLKPMEFPISFFIDYAWNPDAWPADRLPEYARCWAEQQFGPAHSESIADILVTYPRYNRRKTPEMLSPDTYSLIHYREAEKVVASYKALAEKAEAIYETLAPEYRDAYWELVLYPVMACANLNELYVTVAKNRLYASQGRTEANLLADLAAALFEKDDALTRYYHEDLAGGKWNHMMSQTHIGYTYWQQPETNTMPSVQTVEPLAEADMGVAVEGSKAWWPADDADPVLPEMNPYQDNRRYVEIFNRGLKSFDYEVGCDSSWIRIEPASGTVDLSRRVWIHVDWNKAPFGHMRVPLTVSGSLGEPVVVYADVKNPESPRPENVTGFVEGCGVVSIEAEHYTRKKDTVSLQWIRIPDMGRTLSGMTVMPVTVEGQETVCPELEYDMHLFTKGEVEVQVFISPTQNFNARPGGLRFSIAFDEEAPQIVTIHANDTIPDWKYPKWWNDSVSNAVRVLKTRHQIGKPGHHVLRLAAVDPGVVFQKLVVNAGGLKPSYLGPPESYFRKQDRK